METQLAGFDMQEVNLLRELSEAKAVLDMERLSGWEEAPGEWLKNVREGIKEMATDPLTEEDRRQQLEVKRAIVQRLVQKVTIDRDRNLEVYSSLALQKNSLSQNRSKFIPVHEHPPRPVLAQFAGHHLHLLADFHLAVVHVGELRSNHRPFFQSYQRDAVWGNTLKTGRRVVYRGVTVDFPFAREGIQSFRFLGALRADVPGREDLRIAVFAHFAN